MSDERILVVDDDLDQLDQVCGYLSQQGLAPTRAIDGNEALSLLADLGFDLVILDVVMPGMDGFAVCRKIRETSQVPVIMLTAIGDEAAKIQMLQTGADDYVVKPFSLPELHARMLAVLRRSSWPNIGSEISVFSSGDLTIDFQSHQVTVAGRAVDLTATEFSLLKELSSHRGMVMTHRTLLHTVWGAEYGDEREYVRVFVNRLRQKLGDDPASPKFIKTEAGVGYLFIKKD